MKKLFITFTLALFCQSAAIPLHAQSFHTVVEFNETNGAYPYLSSLVQGIDGNLYGTTSGGAGFDAVGTVFRMTPAGRITTIYKFCSETKCSDGRGPAAGLTLGINDNFYGTTQYGGIYGAGTVFEITASGKLTTLYSFCAEGGVCNDGENPVGSLIQASNGNFYGTTTIGGKYASGTVFEITQGGKLTTLHSFCASGEPCTDGERPNAGLVQSTDGSFYGTATFGGTEQSGTLFRITPERQFITLHTFCSLQGCADGAYPYGALVLGTDGNFYGTSQMGGLNAAGTIFQITPSGLLTTLYDFGPCNAGCPDGAYPVAGLAQGSDGNFYGATDSGGVIQSLCGYFNVGCGVAFQITSAGQFTALHEFCPQSSCADGFLPEGGLFQATNGIFYGTTNLGGEMNGSCAGNGCGTAYGISFDMRPFVEPNPDFGKVGRVIGILGNNLKGTTSVTFNGTPAVFKVISDTYVKVEAPTGATTGLIQLTTSSGTLSSNIAFRVIP